MPDFLPVIPGTVYLIHSMTNKISGDDLRLEKIAAIAEIVSSIAIVVTLIYLSIQIQQTNSALLANSRQEIMTAEMGFISTIISNPEVGTNARKPFSELSEAESGQIGNVIAGFLRTREYAWTQYKNGIMDRATMDSYMATFVRWIKMGEVETYYWKLFSKEIDPEFVSYVTALLAKAR